MAVAPSDHIPAMFIPFQPEPGTEQFYADLDPREACFVVARGYANLDGVRYSTVLDDGLTLNGRVRVKCVKAMQQ